MSAAPTGWHHPDVAQAQAALMDREYAAWRAGGAHRPFDAARTLLTLADPASVLDVGCGAAIYAQLVRDVLPAATYRGCDYAEAMVAWVRAHRPGVEVDREDQRTLTYPDQSFDAVLHGCCLIHLAKPLEWVAAILAATRVTRRWVLLHRTPVLTAATAWATDTHRDAYAGQSVEETYVPEADLRAMIAGVGLRILAIERWDVGPGRQHWSVLCTKPAGWAA